MNPSVAFHVSEQVQTVWHVLLLAIMPNYKPGILEADWVKTTICGGKKRYTKVLSKILCMAARCFITI
jgi:hypothetical protein